LQVGRNIKYSTSLLVAVCFTVILLQNLTFKMRKMCQIYIINDEMLNILDIIRKFYLLRKL